MAPSLTDDPVPLPQPDPLQDLLDGDPGSRIAVTRGEHGDPHTYLGAHIATLGEAEGTVIRAYHPRAVHAEILGEGAEGRAMVSIGPGLFAVWLEGWNPESPYRLRFRKHGGQTWEQDDCYRFPVSVTDDDLYYFSEGTHLMLWQCLGARPWTSLGVDGWAFTVWAPNARGVGVVGNFNTWDGRVHAMRRLGSSGMWELFIPGVADGEIYKFEIVDPNGHRVVRADPMARWAEVPPQTASRTYRSAYTWTDDAWMAAHAERNVRREPMAVYEVHLGSWMKDHDPERHVSYRELAPKLVEHVKALGFNYLELLPVAEHPYDGSWGYQITGYFAPTSRYGTPDDFRYFVDYCHRHGIGVIVDWVPAHFVKDAHGLGRFDGTAVYEHEDPRRGEHPDWGTYIFNYGRYEVRNFLVANALYWLQELHVDGLRVDAVASMLYLDYSREEGQWLPNEHGGRENLEAITLLREVNRQVEARFPGRFTVAEESTAWPGITKSVEQGGLGFTLKWNMGWMHDTLNYFGMDPLYRSHHHDQLTFAMVYEYSEAYVNPLSHDEVVHGKGSLLRRMPGDTWRKFANLRALMAYQYTRPGKILLFMGSELASPNEWNHKAGLEWPLLEQQDHRLFHDYLATLGELYLGAPSLWRLDHEADGFEWLACHDRDMSVFAFVRWAEPGAPVESEAPKKKALKKKTKSKQVEDPEPTRRSGEHLVVVLNLTPVPHEAYQLGAPMAGHYRVLLSSDDTRFGGSGFPRADAWSTENEPLDDRDQRLTLTLPPLSAMILSHAPGPAAGPKPGSTTEPKPGSTTEPKPGSTTEPKPGPAAGPKSAPDVEDS